MLDHLELPWLPTEQEKVSCFQQLGIERDLLPRRIYVGHAKGLIHYFPLKMPVAVGPKAAVFVYIDPGMGTRSELDSWGEAHRRPEAQSWVARDLSEAEKEILTLRQAMAEADWDTLERHGGFNAVVKKILQWEQENPVSKGCRSIDDFRLWGHAGAVVLVTRLQSSVVHVGGARV